MISHILRSSIFIRVVCCFSALSLGSQFQYESTRAAIAPFAQQSAQSPRALDPGAPIEEQLGAGRSHQYRVTLGSGEFIHVVVEQRGVDVEVTVFDPDGKQLLQVDNPIGQYGPESVLI